MQFQPIDLYLLSPELSLVVMALVVMAVDLFVKSRRVIAGVSLVGLLISAGFTISLALTHTGTQKAFSNMLIVDTYALFLSLSSW